jgi:hypothetical protein
MESTPSLDFQNHTSRLSQLLAATTYTIQACEAREQFLNENVELVEAGKALIEKIRSIAAAEGQEDQAEEAGSLFFCCLLPAYRGGETNYLELCTGIVLGGHRYVHLAATWWSSSTARVGRFSST